MNKNLKPMCHLYSSNHDHCLLKAHIKSSWLCCVLEDPLWVSEGQTASTGDYFLHVAFCHLYFFVPRSHSVLVCVYAPILLPLFLYLCDQHSHSFIKLIALIIHYVPGTQSICLLFLYYFSTPNSADIFIDIICNLIFRWSKMTHFDQRNTW